ncbi:CPBP family archaeomyxosortase MrtA [Thermococcus sp. Bubb.Bath]|uniref:CPBP family archaeomyxosortase MrtA n=1 Tax=Thermococcus sp. Bubb.Bath TaxID=1638242 RepID=UPI00143A31E7|nr:CPBP family archaeomyxosortase MrtA [Thermococcus sp. Bubb.Bath]NJF24895.1 CPBP family intramembrane metalloprotease [Thermococcus sp. Bubb.Bath]
MERASILFFTLLPLVILARYSPFGEGLGAWAAWLLVVYLAVPLVASKALGFSLREVGIKSPNKKGLRITLILLIFAAFLSVEGTLVPSMVAYYPRFAFDGWWGFLRGELIMGTIMLAHEAFFRGFLLFPLARKNRWGAIIAQDVPYALVHIGKPGIEIPYSLLAGIVFGWADIEGESFVPSFLVHWIGSAFFDLLCLLAKTGHLPWI